MTTNPFTPVSRAFLERTDLSPETRLVAVYLDTFTANWVVREAQVTRALGIGRRAYQRAVRELKAAGLMQDGGRTPQGVKPPVFEGRSEVRDPKSRSLSRALSPITKKRDTKSEIESKSLSRELHLDPPLPSRVEVPAIESTKAGAEQSSSPKANLSTSCPPSCSMPLPPWADEGLKRMHALAYHPRAAK